LLPQIRVVISERSEVGAARRVATDLVEAHGFDATQTGKASLCVTEAATNIIKHAGHGQVLLRVLEHEHIHGLEILALDRGPGMTNVVASMRDGVSTAGSQGTGLGSIARTADHLDIYSPIGAGTVVRAEIWSQPVSSPSLQTAVICLPKTGESVPGDAWAQCTLSGGEQAFMVADGLGHGPEAARAAIAATQVFARRCEDEPAVILETCHKALAATRGAAVSVGRLSARVRKGSFAGVGNVACRMEQGPTRRQFVTHNGTLGHNLRRVQQFDFDFDPAAVVIFHSDGLATHWNLADYPGLAQRHAGVIAAVLYRDHERGGRDDVTVLVIRNHGDPERTGVQRRTP
jgi:anti-sigma regulatory factor (Ser/Thr protein kinase)